MSENNEIIIPKLYEDLEEGIVVKWHRGFCLVNPFLSCNLNTCLSIKNNDIENYSVS